MKGSITLWLVVLAATIAAAGFVRHIAAIEQDAVIAVDEGGKPIDFAWEPAGRTPTSVARPAQSGGFVSNVIGYWNPPAPHKPEPAREGEEDTQGCVFRDEAVREGRSVTAYFELSPDEGVSCKSERRTCTDGVLSGTYRYSSCTPYVATFVEISGFVWNDANDNLAIDNGELGYPGRMVTLMRHGAVVDTAKTDGNGAYVFEEVRSGTGYKITHDVGSSASTGATCDGKRCSVVHSVELTVSGKVRVNFGMK